MFSSLGSVVVRSVDDGHVVKSGDEELVVSKGNMIARGSEMFLEHSDYQALMRHPDVLSMFKYSSYRAWPGRA